MKRGGQVAIFVVIAIFLVAVLIFYYLVVAENDDLGFEIECSTDSDCFAIKEIGNPCCHPDTCVSKSEAPDCSDAICTQGCSGLLDCPDLPGHGSCGCVNSKCEPVIT